MSYQTEDRRKFRVLKIPINKNHKNKSREEIGDIDGGPGVAQQDKGPAECLPIPPVVLAATTCSSPAAPSMASQ